MAEPAVGTLISPAISDYALIGDCHSAALVSRAGSIDWWCPRRFDAPSVFGRLLDPSAGHWMIRPNRRFTVTRRYRDRSMVLETDFATDTGRLRLTDALALGTGERGHDIGRRSPHLLIRRLDALDGEVEVAMGLAIRPEFGLVEPQIRTTPRGLELVGGPDRLLLSAGDTDLHADRGTVSGSITLRAGDRIVLGLQHAPVGGPEPEPLEPAAVLHDTTTAWESWDGLHHGYHGPYAEHVLRSGLVLQALTYQPTGAVVAAPTTSLPEEVGGAANWDYRFGWLRDGSWTLKALWVAACPDEAGRFFDWIATSAGGPSGAVLPIMFGVGGERDLTEHELVHLRGYRDSRPVRVGNDAWRQKQLDVLGEVLECAWILRDQLTELDAATVEFLVSVADRAAATWNEPDAGIWEGREGERHYLVSKLMCWVALDRAVRLRELLGTDKVKRWGEVREDIGRAILEHGWNDQLGAFTGAFGSDHLDAAALLLPLVGFLPADDERVLSTLDAIEKGLGPGELLQRWTGAGDEGAFVICSYWLATARAMAGQVDAARSIFEAVTDHANDVGLLSEEIDRNDGTLLGNFPQALSHIGLINAAWAIAQAEQRSE